MRTLFISILTILFTINLGLAQEFELNLSFDPVVNRLGNLSKQYVSISNNNKQLSDDIVHRSDVRFYNVIGKQVSANLLLKRPRFLIGFDINYFKHSYKFDVVFGFSMISREIISHNLGGSLLIGKEFRFNTRLLVGVEVIFISSLTENIGVPVNYTSVFGGESADMKEEFFPVMNSSIIPKLIGNTKISHCLFINYGFRFKFWDRSFLGAYSFQVKKNEVTYLDFSINSRQLHFFFGVGYTFNTKNHG